MQLYYENERGGRFDLLNHPYAMPTTITGLSSLPSNDISTIENAIVDGVTVTNRIRESRQIIFSHLFTGNVTQTRRELIQTLDQGAPGRLIFDDGEVSAYIDVDVEDCEVQNFGEQKTTATTTFFAAYPYFKKFDTQSVTNKATTKRWTFPWTFPVTFGSLSTNQVLEIENNGDFDTGFTVRYTATGEVQGPRLTNQKGESISFEENTPMGTSCLQMVLGDVVEICTITGNKYAKKNGVSVIGWLDFSLSSAMSGTTATLFPLYRGLNTLRVTALSGIENLDVEILFEDTYKGV